MKKNDLWELRATAYKSPETIVFTKFTDQKTKRNLTIFL